MARSLTAGMITEVTAKSLSPILMLKAEFDSGDLLLWTGVGSLTYSGDTYTGAGQFLSITKIVETTGLSAQGVNITLSAIPSALIALALSEDYQSRPVTVFFACLDSSGALVSDPYQIFKGRMDVLNIIEGGENATLTMQCENLLIDFRRPRLRRYTDEDQKSVYPLDRGLEFVNAMQDKEIVWGKATPKA